MKLLPFKDHSKDDTVMKAKGNFLAFPSTLPVVPKMSCLECEDLI